MDVISCVGTDLVLGRREVTLDELERWISGIRNALTFKQEYHDPYIQWSNLDGSDLDDGILIYVVALRPETELEIKTREEQKKKEEERDRERFDFLKEKYGW